MLDGRDDLFDLFRRGLFSFGVIARQVHRRIPVDVPLKRRQLDVLREVDQDRSRPAGLRQIERLLDDPRDIAERLLHVFRCAPVERGDHVVVLGDRAADFDDRGFLKGVGADHFLSDLAGDGDERHGIHLRVGNGGDEVGGSRPAGGHAQADLVRCARDSLSREAATLFVAREDRPNAFTAPQQGLVQRHGRSARIREDGVAAIAHQSLDEDIGSVQRRGDGLGLGGSRMGLGGGHFRSPQRTKTNRFLTLVKSGECGLRGGHLASRRGSVSAFSGTDERLLEACGIFRQGTTPSF